MDNSLILEVQNLSQAYSSRIVLKDINLQIREGEILTLLGPNGAGKTTLLRVLCGLVRSLKGKIIYGKGCSANLHTPDCSLYHDLTLEENLKLFQGLYQTSMSRYEHLIRSFGLKDFFSQPVRQLSHGQKLRGDLCRTLMLESFIYLLDEPLTGLDKSSASYLFKAIDEMHAEGKAIVMTTHNPQLVKEVTQRWLKLENGQMVWDDFLPPEF